MARSAKIPGPGWLALALLAASGLPEGAGRLDAQALAESLRTRVEAGLAQGELRVGGEPVRAWADVSESYLRRGYRPVWVTEGGGISPLADSLVAVLREAPTHGLHGGWYHLATVEALRRRIQGEERGRRDWDLADLDLLLTDAFLLYGEHLLRGRVPEDQLPSERIAEARSADLPGVLERALADGAVRAALEGLAPAQPEYQRLRRALAQLREAQVRGGWERVEEGPTLREGEADPRVAAVRRRLLSSTEAAERTLAQVPDSLAERFTPALAEAIRSFQHRHGLTMDGAVGAETVAALNVPVAERVRQVQVNLERWRWIPDSLGARHIRVNIAAFETEVWDGGEVVMRLRSIVGQRYRMTPSFSAPMRYLVLSPYWHVPPTIAAEDKLPEIRRDPGYLARLGYTLLEAGTERPVDPRSVDWSAMTGEAFNRRYGLRQDPGPLNALGKVKFMFPNTHFVYLHDTPDRHLFEQVRRDLSSGCIRVERPMELAAFLLAGDPAWSSEALEAAAAAGEERTVFLPGPIPVHVLYMTAFVDPEGHVHFRPDLYGRDAVVVEALAASTPDP